MGRVKQTKGQTLFFWSRTAFLQIKLNIIWTWFIHRFIQINQNSHDQIPNLLTDGRKSVFSVNA